MSLNRTIRSVALAILTVALFAIGALGQEPDNRFPGQKNDPDQPFGLRETQKKMQIDQEKKDYDEMIDRSQQAIKISQDLSKAFEQQPSLTRSDLEKLDDLEKLVKKIRNELGGANSDDDGDDADDVSPRTVADGIKALQNLTGKMADELKKTTRFGISAVAIQSSNSVLKIVRFLKLSK